MLTLPQFTRIDGLLQQLLSMGEYESCTDPWEYQRIDSELLALCQEAMGPSFVNDFACGSDCAAAVVAMALLRMVQVSEGVA